jgi:1,4-alpha-glucan branching enzyme
LISNALFWLQYYHADGLRVDAVASMLYLDYSRNEGEWGLIFMVEGKPGYHQFFKNLMKRCTLILKVQTIAEASFPMVSRPTSVGGLGFGMKWMMGWMHDTLEYFQKIRCIESTIKMN